MPSLPWAPPPMAAPPQQPPRSWQPAPRAAAPRSQPQSQQAANDRYLPPMPEMLRLAGGDPPFRAPTRVAENSARQGSPSPAVVRGQAPDETTQPPALGQPLRRTAGLSIPSPEALGLAAAERGPNPPPADPPLTWSQARELLDAWGMRAYSSEKRGNQRRFACVMADPRQPDREHTFEATADSEADAIQQVIAQVSIWRKPTQAP